MAVHGRCDAGSADRKGRRAVVADDLEDLELGAGSERRSGHEPARRNSSDFYDAKDKKPAGKREGTLKLGALEMPVRRGAALRLGFIMLGTLVSVGLVVLGLARRRSSQC